MRSRYAAGCVLLVIYIASVVAANILTSRYGLVPIAPGLHATAGTAVIGGAIMTRDLIQDLLGRRAVLAAIVAGGVLSLWLAAPVIAAASAATFLAAESLELAVYTPLRRRSWARAVLTANGAGILADTFLFLWWAGFPVTGPGVAGQLLGKAYVTAAVVIARVVVRQRQHA